MPVVERLPNAHRTKRQPEAGFLAQDSSRSLTVREVIAKFFAELFDLKI